MLELIVPNKHQYISQTHHCAPRSRFRRGAPIASMGKTSRMSNAGAMRDSPRSYCGARARSLHMSSPSKRTRLIMVVHPKCKTTRQMFRRMQGMLKNSYRPLRTVRGWKSSLGLEAAAPDRPEVAMNLCHLQRKGWALSPRTTMCTLETFLLPASTCSASAMV